MNSQSKPNRREFLGAVAAIGAASLAGCTAYRRAEESSPGQLPARGEFVVRNAHVLTMDPALSDLPNGDIHVRDGEIIAVGTELAAPSAEAIDGRDMIALPGFIDTHWHLWGSSLRSLISDGDMDYFVVMPQVGPQFTPEDNRRGVRLAIAEGLHSGFTTVHNWSHNLLSPAHADAELQALNELGMRCRFSYGYNRVLQRYPDQLTDLDDVARVQREWFSSPNAGLLTMGFAARGPQAVPPEVYRQEWETVRSLGLPITAHGSRSREETARVRVIEALGQWDLLGPDILLVHAYQATPAEHKLMADTGTKVSISPFTASRLASGFPQLSELLRAGVQVSLSVDTTTIAGSADMFAMMRLALNLHHLHTMDVLDVQPRRVLELATIDGARSLGLADRVGSLTPGKRADLILVRTTDLNTAPYSNPVNILVQSAQPANVDTVVVDGRILKRNGKLVALDAEQVVREAAESLAALQARSGGP